MGTSKNIKSYLGEYADSNKITSTRYHLHATTPGFSRCEYYLCSNLINIHIMDAVRGYWNTTWVFDAVYARQKTHQDVRSDFPPDYREEMIWHQTSALDPSGTVQCLSAFHHVLIGWCDYCCAFSPSSNCVQLKFFLHNQKSGLANVSWFCCCASMRHAEQHYNTNTPKNTYLQQGNLFSLCSCTNIQVRQSSSSKWDLYYCITHTLVILF